MRRILFRHCLLIIVFVCYNGFGQNSDTEGSSNSRNLSFSMGFGGLSVRDQAISDERYSGDISSFILSWQSVKGKRCSQIEFEFYEGSDIKERNLSSEIVLFSLDIDRLFALKPLTFLGKQTKVYLGSSTGTNFYIRQQNIADGDASIFANIPIGPKSKFLVPISQKMDLEFDVFLHLFSFGMRYPSNAIDEADVKLLHLFNGFNLDLNLDVRYRLVDWFSVTVSAGQQAQNITAWGEELLFAKNNVGLGVELNF